MLYLCTKLFYSYWHFIYYYFQDTSCLNTAICRENFEMINLLLSKSYIDVNKYVKNYYYNLIRHNTPLEQIFKYSCNSEKSTEMLSLLLTREDLQFNTLSPNHFCLDYNKNKIDLILLLFRDPRFEISQTDAVCVTITFLFVF